MTEALRAFIKNNGFSELLALPESDEQLKKQFNHLMFNILRRPIWDAKNNEWDSDWSWIRLELRDQRGLLARKKRGGERGACDLTPCMKDYLGRFIGPVATALMAAGGKTFEKDVLPHFKSMRIDTAIALMDIIEDLYIECNPAPEDDIIDADDSD